MVSASDGLVANTLADTVQAFQPSLLKGAAAGYAFEQALYHAILDAQSWRYATPPDQYDLGLPIHTKTGIRYEHDGMFADNTTLYIVEAKYRERGPTRETVGIFVQKLLDTFLGSYDDIGHLLIKPVLVSGLHSIDAAAWRHAVAWGILLISPDRPTPLAILRATEQSSVITPAHEQLTSDCRDLTTRLWRPFNTIVSRRDDSTMDFSLNASNIYGSDKTERILEQWSECLDDAKRLKILARQVHVPSS